MLDTSLLQYNMMSHRISPQISFQVHGKNAEKVYEKKFGLKWYILFIRKVKGIARRKIRIWNRRNKRGRSCEKHTDWKKKVPQQSVSSQKRAAGKS